MWYNHTEQSLLYQLDGGNMSKMTLEELREHEQVSKTKREDLAEFNALPQYRAYEIYARTVVERIQGDNAALLRTGRSLCVVAFLLPVMETYQAAVAEMGASVHGVLISELNERDLLTFLREQDHDKPPDVLTIDLATFANGQWDRHQAVYVVPFNSHWRSVVSSVMNQKES